jgi:ABC-type uncharacterized transport system permease subunit
VRRTAPTGGPILSRWAAIGLLCGFIVGAVLGLVVGLDANPSTAWFAVFEAGIPAAFLGGLIGVVSAAVTHVVQRCGRRRTSSLRATE